MTAALKNMFAPISLPCGVTLKNRIVKSAMSDSLGDGTGHPTKAQENLYARWAAGGAAAAIVGEVQCNSRYAEKPGNLVLDENADLSRFHTLAQNGGSNGSFLWLQLGHAGALAYASTSRPAGPSALNLPELICAEISIEEIQSVPNNFARTAKRAKDAGFGGVQIHAAHGFLLSQFLSPLFNKRSDQYGGSIENRMRLTLETIANVRAAVGPNFPIAIKLNSSDQLEGGLTEDDSLKVVQELDHSSVDVIDISGGTYFPGAKSASDSSKKALYFLEFAVQARGLTTKPIMLTGGIKSREQAEAALATGAVDIIGLARAFALNPNFPNSWQSGAEANLQFPRFSETPIGGVTAWFTMRLSEIGENTDSSHIRDIHEAIQLYESRDAERTNVWLDYFDRAAI